MAERNKRPSELSAFDNAIIAFAMEGRAVREPESVEAEVVDPIPVEFEAAPGTTPEQITRAEFEERMERLDRQIEMMLACSRANIETAAALRATLEQIPRLAEAAAQQPAPSPAAPEPLIDQNPPTPHPEPVQPQAQTTEPVADPAPRQDPTPQPAPAAPARQEDAEPDRGDAPAAPKEPGGAYPRRPAGNLLAYAAAALLAASGVGAAIWAALRLGGLA